MEIVLDGKRVISAQQAAFELGQSFSTFLRAAKQGTFRTTRLNALFIDAAQLNEWKEAQASKKAKSSN